MSDTQAKIESELLLRPCQAPSPWEAFLLPVSGFPIPETELAPVRTWWNRLSGALSEQWRLSTEVFIQMTQLKYSDGSSIRVASHGREWIPRVGLGVWPDREAPKLWTRADFENLGPGERPRRLMYQVLQITKSPEARDGARNTMLGFGAVMEIMVAGAPEEFLPRATEALLPGITDPSFTCFPFYVPLLEVKSAASADAGQLSRWCSGASVYIRESVEDNGIAIICERPLDSVLQGLGGRFDASPEPEWRFRL